MGTQIRGVGRFYEKPVEAVARNLMALGWLWNSFVMVGRLSTLLGLVTIASPQLYSSFATLRHLLGTPLEETKVKTLYAGLTPVDFSSDILAKVPVNLSVLPVRGVGWSDLGEVSRVIETWTHLGLQPRWAAA